jgi:DNA transformation protein
MNGGGEFVELVLEQLAPLGSVRVRAMFGGYGVYQGDVFFAIIVDDRLYFKTDRVTCVEYQALGLLPFSYTARGKTITMQYYEAPPEVFEDMAVMRRWAQQAIAVAQRAKERGKKLPKTEGRRKSKST